MIGARNPVSRAELAEGRDRLLMWDRHHSHAQKKAQRLEERDEAVFEYMPETTMCSEYMPGRLALLEAADPNDWHASKRYRDAAFRLMYSGPFMYMPLDCFNVLACHDDVRRKWRGPTVSRESGA